ncbi:type II toxin-antitoxin system PemK/MazF family toxin [Rothia aerolata]|uniref:type II toxin-antitoxin system PemK/MazF family toxin n=1 Tax=Rothia aerolata TaxID=1812262 RepID=UPI001667693D|nr:type II toxin-antitoxin system PemK/MazF family toxin [Rothia aerolata]
MYREPVAIVAESLRGTVTVLPITSNVRFVAPFQVLLPAHESGLGKESKARAEQIRTVSVNRLGDYLGTLSSRTMWQIDYALKLHLAL